MTYGKMYGVTKTTLYLAESLKRALERRARIEGRSEADIIREALEVALEPYQGAEPTLPVFSSTELTSDRTEELLADFGAR
jgi:hypothetical protein